MTNLIARALARWGMVNVDCAFVAGRENQVYRISCNEGDFALRIRRPGLRNEAELRSELIWLNAMRQAGLCVPRPKRSAHGRFLERIDRHAADMTGWLTGRPLGREPLQIENVDQVFFALGRETARLHTANDAFIPPQGFVRPDWNIDGLLGETPLWDRFWQNPTLDEDARRLLQAFRRKARRDLTHLANTLDYGLIHADIVRENVLIDGECLRLIDFDDGGYGFRLFDIATTLLKHRKEACYETIRSNLIEGYRTVRWLDVSQLDLFLSLRAVTYVGWSIRRMAEDGVPARNARFIADAHELCTAYLDQPSTI